MRAIELDGVPAPAPDDDPGPMQVSHPGTSGFMAPRFVDTMMPWIASGQFSTQYMQAEEHRSET